MVTLSDKVIEDVLSLPADQRINLADRILASLNPPTDPEIDGLWAVEAERRIKEIEEGTVKLIPGEDVFSRIHQKFST